MADGAFRLSAPADRRWCNAKGIAPYALCLLSASSYTTRFAEDLEDVFPHVPFPAEAAVFADAARLGAQIRGIETFGQAPDPVRLRTLARAATEPLGPLGAVVWTDGDIRLCADGSGLIRPVPRAVWEFAVSGYRVLPRWLAAREGMVIEVEFIPELQDLIGRIAALIDLFAAADNILHRTLAATLSRAALGISMPEARPSDVPD